MKKKAKKSLATYTPVTVTKAICRESKASLIGRLRLAYSEINALEVENSQVNKKLFVYVDVLNLINGRFRGSDAPTP